MGVDQVSIIEATEPIDPDRGRLLASKVTFAQSLAEVTLLLLI
jgi:hypothetical protein